MPKAAYELGAVERQLPLERIGRAALEKCSANVKGAA
jgi:chemotaxis response regulator CheB